MPHASSPPRVSFSPEPIYSRLPHDDEMYVMKAFTKHASHCPVCVDPLAMHRKGGTLCQRGHRRASDVAQYVYNKRGQAYSVVDREGNGASLVQIEIPAKAESLRSLLKAMERGLKVGSGVTEELRPRPIELHHEDSHKRRARKEKPMPIYTGDVYVSTGRKVYMTRGERAEKNMRERERFYGHRGAYYQPHMIYSPAPVGGFYYR